MAEYINTVPREEQDKRGTVRTFTGRYVKPLAMRGEDICIEDIAHQLAGEPRYCSATPDPYSVAQHSCYVALFFTSPRVQLAALLHDAAEAYLKDIPSPVKHDPRFEFYREIEEELEETIRRELGVLWLFGNERNAIKEADNAVFRIESRFFFGDHYTPAMVWGHKYAEARFLEDFHKYTAALRNLEDL